MAFLEPCLFHPFGGSTAIGLSRTGSSSLATTLAVALHLSFLALVVSRPSGSKRRSSRLLFCWPWNMSPVSTVNDDR